MMKNKEETPIKPIIREKMLKLQYPRSWNLSKYKYFLKIRVAVFFVESWISRSVLYRVIVLTGSQLVLYQNDKTPKSQPEAFLDEGFLWKSSSGWLLGIFWFRYWTGGGNHPVPFCGSSVTESNFQAVLFLVVPSEYLSHWQKFTIAAMPTVCCRWKDDKIVWQLWETMRRIPQLWKFTNSACICPPLLSSILWIVPSFLYCPLCVSFFWKLNASI